MSARILIVDDVPLNLKLLSAKLAMEYYVVETAHNGAEAIEKSLNFRPDIILLDVMMPDMDGFEVCHKLKENPETAFIPIIMVTSLTDTENKIRGLEAGAEDFLTKPINDIALMARIRSSLRTKTIVDEWRSREQTTIALSNLDSASSGGELNITHSNILVVDDGQLNINFIKHALYVLRPTIIEISSIKEIQDITEKSMIDLVLSNLNLKHEDGLTVCPTLRSMPLTRHVPVLLIAREPDTEKVVKGLDLGANDYLIEPLDEQELFARVKSQLRHKKYYEILRSGVEQNIMFSFVDPLTSAFNRRYLDAHLPRALQMSKTQKKPLSMLMLDIDFFKKINDTYGHGTGDEVIRSVSGYIANSTRPSDFLVRMGGEEFVVVMPETRLDDAFKVADRIRRNIEKDKVTHEGNAVEVTVSIGVAEASESSSVESLFEAADKALYMAKEGGRN
ncbi:MAG: PleD family two-component system response regulator, partial [Alphaproteobacteria bacterium]|nr:PleD family two-component system response regulator [Alphaproteobacteria bacterium]